MKEQSSCYKSLVYFILQIQWLATKNEKHSLGVSVNAVQLVLSLSLTHHLFYWMNLLLDLIVSKPFKLLGYYRGKQERERQLLQLSISQAQSLSPASTDSYSCATATSCTKEKPRKALNISKRLIYLALNLLTLRTFS